jgi:hypothetical protein
MQTKWVFSLGLGIILVGLGSYAWLSGDAGTSARTVVPVARDATAIFSSHDALYSYVKAYGPRATTERLHELSASFGDCHESAHLAGRYSYEVYGEESFKLCSSECHSGCYHGATEAYFKEHGTANLEANLNTLCSSELNGFLSHQCVHGIGHGLMAWTSYDLPEALEGCNLLSLRKDSCWTGVFMENIVGGLAKADIEKPGADSDAAVHFTKYLSDDPLYPCNDPKLDEKYRGSCYFLQTSRMLQIFGTNFEKVGDACATAPALYQRSCFESMGRDVGGTFRKDAPGAIAACGNAPLGSARTGCIVGAVQDSFWDPSGEQDAIGFCKLLTLKAEKDACYDTIIGRAPDVLISKAAREAFCGNVEGAYKAICKTRVGV